MEQNSEKNNNALTNSPSGSSRGKKRRRGAVHLMKVALFMIRGRASAKPKPADVAVGGNMLNRLVGSMRPLHLQNGDPPEQDCADPPGSSSDGMSSRYASAENLQELDAGGGGESRYASAVNLREMDEDGDGDGDETIDARAEQFIAQFYAQIRLQRLNSIDRRYNEMIERSIS